MSPFIQKPHLWFAAIFLVAAGMIHAQETPAPAAVPSSTQTNLTTTDEASASPARRRHHTLRSTALKRLEQDLARTFGFSKHGSRSRAIDELHRLPAPVAPPRTRGQDDGARERDRDWAFLNPDELSKAPSAEELFNVKNLSPEDKERSRLSAMERYFDNMDRQRMPGASELKPAYDDLFGSKWSSRTDETLNRNSPTDLDDNPEVARREMALRQMLGLDSIQTAPAGNRPAESLLGFGKVDAPPVSDILRPSRQSFEELYNPRRSTASTPLSSLGIPATGGLDPYATPAPETRNPAAVGSSGLSSYLNPAPTTRSTSMGALSTPGSPGYSPASTLPDFNSQVLNAWNPARTAPREEPATRPRTTIPPSDFNTPQRTF